MHESCYVTTTYLLTSRRVNSKQNQIIDELNAVICLRYDIFFNYIFVIYNFYLLYRLYFLGACFNLRFIRFASVIYVRLVLEFRMLIWDIRLGLFKYFIFSSPITILNYCFYAFRRIKKNPWSHKNPKIQFNGILNHCSQIFGKNQRLTVVFKKEKL